MHRFGRVIHPHSSTVLANIGAGNGIWKMLLRQWPLSRFVASSRLSDMKMTMLAMLH
jgi:hypothetical protein